MNARLIALTQSFVCDPEGKPYTAEELLVYIARVSNPSNQNNVATGERLLKYCLDHSHWSVFESVSMTVEVQTSRAIAAQILRHRSFTFQEFSQRYAVATDFEPIELRSQDTKNRQGSGEVFDPLLGPEDDQAPASEVVDGIGRLCKATYDALIEAGVSKETARMVLPLCTRTTLYITGNVRSWIHYFGQRCSPHAQKEHRLLAESIRDTCFKPHFPIIHSILSSNDQVPSK